MRDAPKRWLSETARGSKNGIASATPFERDILRTGVDVDPPPEAQALVMAALMAKIGAASAAGGAAASAAGAASAKGGAALAGGGAATGATAGVIASSATSTAVTAASAVKVAAGFGLLKSVLLGAGAAAVMIGGYTAATSKSWSASTPPSAATSMVIESKAPQAPLASKPNANVAPNSKASEDAPAPADTTIDMDAPPINLDSLPTVTTSVPPPHEARSSSRPSTATVAPHADETDEPNQENALMTEARDTLRGGNPAGALAKLAEIPKRVPHGTMGQEREALTIEALYRSGNKAAASERAKAFLKAYPGSIHASKLEAMISP